MNTAKELMDQSISDIRSVLICMVCESEEMQAHCEEMLSNVSDQIGKALDLMLTELNVLRRMNEDKEKHIRYMISSGSTKKFFSAAEAEIKAVGMSESGKSLSAIASAIFGAKNGQRVKQVRTWIENHRRRNNPDERRKV